MRDIVFNIVIFSLYAVLLFDLGYLMMKNSTTKKLTEALVRRDKRLYDMRIKSFGVKTLNKFEIEDIKFNVYMDQLDHVQLENTIQRIDSFKLTIGQIKKIYPKIFYYYIKRGQYANAQKYYDTLAPIKYKKKKIVEIIYSAYVKKEYTYLDDALKILEKTKADELPVVEYAISQIYTNKNDNPNAKKYSRLAEKHQKELDIQKSSI